LREGGLSPDDALAEVFRSARQLEDAGAAYGRRVPNTPPNFQTAPTTKSSGSSQPSVFRRGAAGLEPVKTFEPDPIQSNVVVNRGGLGPVTQEPKPTVGGAAIAVAVMVGPDVAEGVARKLGASDETVHATGFFASVGVGALAGAEAGAPIDGFGALPGAIVGGIAGGIGYLDRNYEFDWGFLASLTRAVPLPKHWR